MYVHRGECLYVYAYLHLYYVSKKSTGPVLTHTCCSLFIHIDLYIKIKMSDCLILQAMLSLVVINKPFRDLANQETKPR
jgi:hypothetical protein